MDMHSHLIPGIDDGSKNVDESIMMIKALLDLGFSRIITTPHILPGYFLNTKADIVLEAKNLQKHIEAEGLGIELLVAAEYYTDEHLLDLLEKDELLPLPGKHLLFELPVVDPPHNLHDYIFAMQTRGYIPLLAHPERYVYAYRDRTFLKDMRGLGVKFQMNILSLSGAYGQGPSTLATDLLDKGWYDFAATDLHNPSQVQALHEALHVMPHYEFANKELKSADGI